MAAETIIAIGLAKAAIPVVVPLILRIAKRAKLYNGDDKINKDIEIILAELETIDDEAKEQIKDRLAQIQTWLIK